MPKTDASHLWGLNYRMTMSVMADIAPAIRVLKLEIKELFLLAEIDAHPHPADLARELVMPKPTVTVIVKRLEAAGYVRRSIDAGDLRRHRLTVTATGKTAVGKGLAIVSAAYGERLARLSATELAQLKAIFEKLS